MSIDLTPTTDPLEAADTQAVMDHLVSKKPLPPDVYRRVQERAAKITDRIREKHGVLNVAVDLIRDARDQ